MTTVDDARRVEGSALGAAAAVLDPTASHPVRATQIAKKIIEAYLAAVGGVVARETADKLAEAVDGCRWQAMDGFDPRSNIVVPREDWQAVQRALAAYRRDAP